MGSEIEAPGPGLNSLVQNATLNSFKLLSFFELLSSSSFSKFIVIQHSAFTENAISLVSLIIVSDNGIQASGGKCRSGS